MNLSRSNGIVYDYGTPIIFAGGQYYFTSPAGGDRALVDTQGRLIIRNYTGTSDGCPPPAETNPPPPATKASRRLWANWNDLFANMQQCGVNLLRIFLTGGTAMAGGAPVDLFPYNRTAGGKLRVRAAIEATPPSDQFSVPYFNRLRDFVLHADERGIAVQLCLFNYYDLVNGGDVYYQAWPQSLWNPDATDDPAWGRQNLVNDPNGNANTRGAYFVDTANTGLMNTQQKLVSRVVAAVRNCKNVIFEIMNEPRGTSSLKIATWYSRVTEWILAAAGPGWRPLISVNAAAGNDGAFDIDTWKSHSAQLPHYPDVDMVSYHGLTGYPQKQLAVCGGNPLMSLVDRGHINSRASAHRGAHPDKAMIFSTDAVAHQGHFYNSSPAGPVLSMYKRDGQITTALSNDVTAVDQDTQIRRSDLGNWAYWCLYLALKPRVRQGNVHFQNLSSFLASFQAINDAFSQAIEDTGVPRPVISRGAGG